MKLNSGRLSNYCVHWTANVKEQCQTGNIEFGNIGSDEVRKETLLENCILENLAKMDVNDYAEFLAERRKLMAKLVEKYDKGL